MCCQKNRKPGRPQGAGSADGRPTRIEYPSGVPGRGGQPGVLLLRSQAQGRFDDRACVETIEPTVPALRVRAAVQADPSDEVSVEPQACAACVPCDGPESQAKEEEASAGSGQATVGGAHRPQRKLVGGLYVRPALLWQAVPHVQCDG